MPVWPADADAIARAAELLRAGELVAFPTETVYGLGAHALDPQAVVKIFAAKGRPATNPVIVHVQDAAQAQSLAAEWPETAAKLVAAFWPGPLTLVLRKRGIVPEIVTAGGPTVALRCPNHAVAMELLKACQFPLAAPSANRSTALSPTRAEHVFKSFGDSIPILDGGPCPGGLESTVVDVTGDAIRILRPGLITAVLLEPFGPVVTDAESSGILRSPGQMAKHYSPRARITLLQKEAPHESNAAYVLLGSRPDHNGIYYLPNDPSGYSQRFYALLHAIDDTGVDVIVVEPPPETPEWAAIRDRLRRAAS